MIEKKNILGVSITNATQKDILEYIVKNLQNFKKKLFIITSNPEFVILANKNPDYRNILNRADLALADGIGIIIAGKILGKSLKERFTGVDLVESLCEKIAEKPITVGFLGGRAGVADKTAECLRKKHPGLKVSFIGEEWPNIPAGPVASFPPASAPSTSSVRAVGSPSSGTTPRVSSSIIHDSQFIIHPIDILFVAFGAPKQEIWINENLENLPVKIAIGVGGAFDYISGRVGRSPVWMQNIGLEWLYRLIRQPWRIKRQFSLVEFAWLVFKEELTKSRTIV